MKTLEPKTEVKTYFEFYFGVGFGLTRIDGKTLVILPFVIFLFVDETIYK